MDILRRSALRQIQVLSDHRDTEICDLCTAGDVHNDIRLAEYQYDDEERPKNYYTPLRDPRESNHRGGDS